MQLELLALLASAPAYSAAALEAAAARPAPTTAAEAGKCDASTFLQDTDYHGDGQGLGHAPGTSAGDCCTQCASGKYPGCAYFSFAAKVCWFFQDNKGPRNMTGAVSGGTGAAPAPTPPPPPLPPAPPLPPVPTPQPNCSTCKWPQHSWATIPASIHTSRTNTGPDGTFTDQDVENMKKFPLITIEKWQGTDAVDASGKRVFIWQEDAWVNSAKKIKAANPDASVVAWMDTMLVYTGWRLDGSSLINHTFNPDANSACATGHFRPAEFIERYPQLLVHNSSDELAITQYGGCHVYDHQQARVRQYWRDKCVLPLPERSAWRSALRRSRLTKPSVVRHSCLKMTAAGLDGCGADFSAGGPNSMARNTVQNTMSFLGVNESVATAWRAGKRQMMIDTTAALGNGLLVGKDAAELGDHVNAVLHEGCDASNGTITLLRGITAKALATKQRLLYQCHTRGGMGNDTVAAFLIGAGVDHYIASGGWSQAGKAPISNRPAILDLPLGAPTADAVYDAATTMWHRSFASGTRVSFNASCTPNRKAPVCPGTGIVWGGQK